MSIRVNISLCCCEVRDILNRFLKVLLMKMDFCNMVVDVRVIPADFFLGHR